MALTYDNMPCAICGKRIRPWQEMFCTTAWGTQDERFVVLDDTAAHQTCVDSWPLRDEFILYYNKKCRDELYVDDEGHVAYRVNLLDRYGSTIFLIAAAVPLLPTMIVAVLLSDFSSKTWILVTNVIVALGIVVIAILWGYMTSGVIQAIWAGGVTWAAMIGGSLLLMLAVMVWNKMSEMPPRPDVRPTIAIRLDATGFDPNVRFAGFELLDLLTKSDGELLQGDGCDRLPDIVLYLRASDVELGLQRVLDVVQNQTLYNQKLSDRTVVALENAGGEFAVVYPEKFTGQFLRS